MDIDEAIKNLTTASTKPEVDSSDALRYTQAALNLAQVKRVLNNVQLETAPLKMA